MSPSTPRDPERHPPQAGTPLTWDRVRGLFHEALELEPAAWDSFLSKVAEDDPVLAREVRSLLSAHEQSRDFLATPPVPPLSRMASPGDRVGRYRVVEEIGRGGMGVV